MIEAHGAFLDTVSVAFVGVDTPALIENRLHYQLHPGKRKVLLSTKGKVSINLKNKLVH